MEDAKRWAEMYKQRISILKIAKQDGVDPGTVSTWLKKLGVELRQGSHFVIQPTINEEDALLRILSRGPNAPLSLLKERAWGINFSPDGLNMLSKYCEFVKQHQLGKGVIEIAEAIGVHRSTVLDWRNGEEGPYLVKALRFVYSRALSPRWKAMPTSMSAGGNESMDGLKSLHTLEAPSICSLY